MIIKSKEYQVTKKELYKIGAVNYFKKILIFALIYFVIFGAAIFFGLVNMGWLITVILIFFVAMPLFVAISLLFYVNSKENKIFFKKRYFEIENNFLINHLDDGSSGRINIDNIIKVIKTAKYYLLYVSAIQFHYLPKSAFLSAEDIEKFDTLLKEKKLLKNK